VCDPHRARCYGTRFQITIEQQQCSPDIRAGISLLIAALLAKGTSTIQTLNKLIEGTSVLTND
jgi:UDP-N-acetylglucosamine 1-carboxyvinyltransferase